MYYTVVKMSLVLLNYKKKKICKNISSARSERVLEASLLYLERERKIVDRVDEYEFVQ